MPPRPRGVPVPARCRVDSESPRLQGVKPQGDTACSPVSGVSFGRRAERCVFRTSFSGSVAAEGRFGRRSAGPAVDVQPACHLRRERGLQVLPVHFMSLLVSSHFKPIFTKYVHNRFGSFLSFV